MKRTLYLYIAVVLFVICLAYATLHESFDDNTVTILNKDILSPDTPAAEDSNRTSNKAYNSDNLDITYHADPLKETPSDSNNLAVGQMWMKDLSGNLTAVPYSSQKNTTHYYPSGSYVFNPPAYVPNYEDSVFLSKLTNLPVVSDIPREHSHSDNPSDSVIGCEASCNRLDKCACRKSNRCVLFGGEKCVAGDAMGPTNKSNYSDITVFNRDYYVYNNTCYGNCP